MVNFLLTLIFSMFSIRPLGSTFIYVDLNQASLLKVELVNDNLQRNMVFQFVRVSLPSDFQFMQCIRGMCYYADSVQIIVPPEIVDTIQLDFFAGSEPGPVNAIYRVYDANRPQDRDSIHITGQVPVSDTRSKVYYKSGVLFGYGLQKVEVYDAKGVLTFSRVFNSAETVPLRLKKGVYFLRIFSAHGVENLRVVEVN